MFKENISETALTTVTAEGIFNNRITADNFRGDATFAATARALFHQRILANERIRIGFTNTVLHGGCVDAQTITDTVSDMTDGDLKILSVSVRSDSGDGWAKKCKKTMHECLPDMYEMDDICSFMSRNGMNAVIFTNAPHDPAVPKSPTTNTKTIVVIESLSLTRWHFLQTIISRLLAKWFTEKPLTAEERDGIIMGLKAETPGLYIDAINRYAEQLDLRGENIKAKLSDFEVRFEKERADSMEKALSSIDRRISEYSEKIGEQLVERDRTVAELWGYRNHVGEESHATMDFFLCNKNLVLDNVTRDSISFYAYGYLDNYDPDKATATFAKGKCNSWLEYNEDFGVCDNDAILLYKALFLDNIVKVRLWSYFKIALRGDATVRAGAGEKKPAEIQHALCNPHHCYHNCLGDYSRIINEAMVSRDIIGAISQCQIATRGINLMEHASYKYFSRDLFNPELGEIIELPDGSWVTANDAITWLRNEPKK